MEAYLEELAKQTVWKRQFGFYVLGPLQKLSHLTRMAIDLVIQIMAILRVKEGTINN